MCHDDGEDRVVGTYEELVAQGIEFPFPVRVAGLNIRIQDGISLFARYLRAEEADWHPDERLIEIEARKTSFTSRRLAGEA